MQIAYLVSGTSGSYEDRCTWSVAIYLDKTLAEAHCALANEHGGALATQLIEAGEYWTSQSTWFDHNFQICGGDPVYYSMQEVPFLGTEPLRDMTSWYALLNPQAHAAEEALSDAEQAAARAAFLASLPQGRPSKKK